LLRRQLQRQKRFLGQVQNDLAHSKLFCPSTRSKRLSYLTVPPTRCGGFTLSPQRGEGRGEGWEIRWAQTSPSSALELNHPSPSIPLPIEGRGKSRIRLHSIFWWYFQDPSAVDDPSL
jgi:hypothetical protein